MQHVGERIKEIVTKSGLKQKEIADKLDVSVQHLHNLFAKESVDTKYLHQLAEIFNIPITSFFERENETNDRSALSIELEKIKKENEELREMNLMYKRLLASNNIHFHSIIADLNNFKVNLLLFKDYASDKIKSESVKNDSLGYINAFHREMNKIIKNIKILLLMEQDFNENTDQLFEK